MVFDNKITLEDHLKQFVKLTKPKKIIKSLKKTLQIEDE